MTPPDAYDGVERHSGATGGTVAPRKDVRLLTSTTANRTFPLRVHESRRWCRVCDWRPVRADGRCHACYEYRRRHGHDRPESLIVAHGQRMLAKEFIR